MPSTHGGKSESRACSGALLSCCRRYGAAPATAPALTTAGYAVWALPDAADARALQTVVGALGTNFPPHVTILRPRGRLAHDADALARAVHGAMDATMLQRAVAGPDVGGGGGSRGGMELELLAPQAADAPLAEDDTQAVLAPVDPSTAASLVAVRTALCAASGDDALPFAPHLTLLYGELDAQTRQRAAQAAADALEWPRPISVGEIAVASVSGPPEQWEIVARVRLQ